jgi:hypothetical protein
MAVKIILDRRAKLYRELSEDEAAVRWKADFESDYCDDFDRALIT